MKIVRELVKEYVARRKALGLSQKRFADASGIAWITIKNLEQGYTNGSVRTWGKINGTLERLEKEIK